MHDCAPPCDRPRDVDTIILGSCLRVVQGCARDTVAPLQDSCPFLPATALRTWHLHVFCVELFFLSSAVNAVVVVVVVVDHNAFSPSVRAPPNTHIEQKNAQRLS